MPRPTILVCSANSHYFERRLDLSDLQAQKLEMLVENLQSSMPAEIKKQLAEISNQVFSSILHNAQQGAISQIPKIRYEIR